MADADDVRRCAPALDLFFTAPGYDGRPLVMVRLERVGRARLAELVGDAWRMRTEG